MSPGPCSTDLELSYRKTAAQFRKKLQDAVSRVVFVPHYKFQDVAHRNVCLLDCIYPKALARRDWLARISAGVAPETDGIYAADFWMRQHERNNRAPRLARRFMHHAQRTNRPVMPLIRAGRAKGESSLVCTK